MGASGFDWIAGAWSALAGVTAAVGVVCLAAAFLDRLRPNPLAAFAVCAFSVAVYTVLELMMLRAQTAEAYGGLLGWSHVPLAAVFASAIVFVRLQLRAGRPWLANAALGLWVAALVLDVRVEPDIGFREITSVRQVELPGGARVAVARGVVDPWTGVAMLAVLACLAFVADATIECRRRGGTIARRATFIGGSVLVAFGGAATYGYLVLFGIVDSVHALVPPLTAGVLAVGGALGTDVAAAALSRRLQEIELQRRRDAEHFALASEAAQFAPWEFDPSSGEFLLVDRARARLGFGPRDRIDPRRLLDELDPADRATAKAEVARLLRGGGGDFEFEYRVDRPGPQTRWLHTRGRLETDVEGRVALLRGVTFDVTERREADEQFRMLLEAAAFGMVGVDREGTIVLASTRAERLFGYAGQELVGRPVRALLGECAHERFSAELARVFAADAAPPEVQHELVGQCKDGSAVPLAIALTPIRFHGEAAVLASVVDLTERKRAEAQVEEQRIELSHLSRVTMLGELSGALAHELNQPLTAILSNAQAALRFLESDAPDLGEVRAILRDVVGDDKRAGEIIRGLRLLLKRGEMRHEDLDLNAVVLDVLRFLRSSIVNANVEVVTELEPGLRPVDGDRVQLQQVVMNLVVNACDAMQGNAPGSRRLVVRTYIEDGRLARVCVTDQGHGIEPGLVERIFDPFFTSKPGGLGLGLAVCRQIVSAHGGRLWARSDPGRGASLLFTLPVVDRGRS